MTPTELAKFFHETYERLAPNFGYKTRTASAVPWDQVPEQNKNLMVAVAEQVLIRLEKEKHIKTLVAKSKEAKAEIYSHPDCIYNYCPYNNECKLRGDCEHRRIE